MYLVPAHGHQLVSLHPDVEDGVGEGELQDHLAAVVVPDHDGVVSVLGLPAAADQSHQVGPEQ